MNDPQNPIIKMGKLNGSLFPAWEYKITKNECLQSLIRNTTCKGNRNPSVNCNNKVIYMTLMYHCRNRDITQTLLTIKTDISPSLLRIIPIRIPHSEVDLMLTLAWLIRDRYETGNVSFNHCMVDGNWKRGNLIKPQQSFAAGFWCKSDWSFYEEIVG